MIDSFRRAVCALSIAVPAMHCAAQTQDQTPNHRPSLQETLQSIPQAGLSCRREDLAQVPETVPARTTAKPDKSCALTLEQLASMPGDGRTVLVDIRAREEFEASHVDGAVNFKPSEIKTKRFLANRPLVLVGGGKAEQELYELCAELKAGGLAQTRVLRGGMIAWIMAGRPVTGRAPGVMEAARLSPVELYQKSMLSETAIIVSPDASRIGELLPAAIKLRDGQGDSIKNTIISYKKKKAGAPFEFVLIAGAGLDEAQFRTWADIAKPGSLLIYSDSEESYRRFLRTQNALWSKQAKGPNKPRCGAM